MKTYKDFLIEALSLNKSDRKVIDAFIDKTAMDGKSLATDGKSLEGLWIGGKDIAVWENNKIIFNDLGSKSAQTVQRAIKKAAPSNRISESFLVRNTYKISISESSGKKFMMTAKDGRSGSVKKQSTLSYSAALSFLSNSLIKLEKIDSTSADLRAMKILDDITKTGQPKGIENTNGMVVVIQKA